MKMVTLPVFPLLALPFPLVVLMLPQSAKTLLVPILPLSPMVLRLNLRISTRLIKTERRLAYKDQMWQVLTKQKLSASTITRWVISQESAEHPEVRKKEGKKAIDKGLKLKKRLQKH
nr:hypothetical protein [Tanacetum cinerariifolium]